MKILGQEFISKETFKSEGFENSFGEFYLSKDKVAVEWNLRVGDSYRVIPFEKISKVSIIRGINRYIVYVENRWISSAWHKLEDARGFATLIDEKVKANSGKSISVFENLEPDITNIVNIGEPDGCLGIPIYMILHPLWNWILGPIINVFLRALLPKHK